MKTVTVSNQKMIKILNWFNTTGRWITIQLYIVLQMLGVTALVCWAAIKYVPPKWDWGVVITQCVAFAVGATCVRDHLRRSFLHHKDPIIYVWFSTDCTKLWYYRHSDSRISTFVFGTFKLLKILTISPKYNAIALAVVGVLYAAVEVVKTIQWDVGMFYVLGGLVGIGLVMYIVTVIFKKTVKFYQFCRQMLAINEMIKETRSWEYHHLNGDLLIRNWKAGHDRLKKVEVRFATDCARPQIEEVLAKSGKTILAASFHIKPPGESASREMLRETSLQLEELGRSLIGNTQAADSHLFQVRKKHEESKKKPAEAASN